MANNGSGSIPALYGQAWIGPESLLSAYTLPWDIFLPVLEMVSPALVGANSDLTLRALTATGETGAKGDCDLPALESTGWASPGLSYTYMKLPMFRVSAGSMSSDMELPVLEATASASSDFVIVASANVSLPKVSAEAHRSGESSDVSLPTLEASATAGTIVGSADVELPFPTVLGSNVNAASVTIPKLTANASALVGRISTADISLPVVSASAVAVVGQLGGTVSLPSFSVSASGLHGAVGDGDCSLYPFTLSARAFTGEVGDVDINLTFPTISAEAYQEIDADGDVSIPAMEMYGWMQSPRRWAGTELVHSRG